MSEAQKILGSNIDVTSYDNACERIYQWIKDQQSCYVIAANVHVTMIAYWNLSYRQIVENAALVTPDGMPLVVALRWLGCSKAMRVYGPDLMLRCCEMAAQHNLGIYLYGGTHEMLSRLKAKLQARYPTLEISGVHSPPFRSLTSLEEQQDIERIHNSGAAIVFVALGCPKQEEWMARQHNKLNAVMIGVGAAFGFHSGIVRQAPRWMMAMGLEWVYRLFVEPRRLWKRYFINNPAFIFLFCIQLLRHHFVTKFSSPPSNS